MTLPTTTEIRTAIEVLNKLGERLNEEAAHSRLQMPDTRLGNEYAAKIEVRTIEQTSRIQDVKSRLENWCEELNQGRRHSVSNGV